MTVKLVDAAPAVRHGEQPSRAFDALEKPAARRTAQPGTTRQYSNSPTRSASDRTRSIDEGVRLHHEDPAQSFPGCRCAAAARTALGRDAQPPRDRAQSPSAAGSDVAALANGWTALAAGRSTGRNQGRRRSLDASGPAIIARSISKSKHSRLTNLFERSTRTRRGWKGPARRRIPARAGRARNPRCRLRRAGPRARTAGAAAPGSERRRPGYRPAAAVPEVGNWPRTAMPPRAPAGRAAGPPRATRRLPNG